MIRKDIHIKGWDCKIFFCIHKYVERVLEDALHDVDAPISVIVRMREIARDDEYNTGFTYSNGAKRKSVCVIGKTTSYDQLLNTFTHELRHLVDDIAYRERMEMRGEDVAYLTGDIAQKLADVVGTFICPKCSK